MAGWAEASQTCFLLRLLGKCLVWLQAPDILALVAPTLQLHFGTGPEFRGYIQGAQQSQLPQQMSQVASGMLFKGKQMAKKKKQTNNTPVALSK